MFCRIKISTFVSNLDLTLTERSVPASSVPISICILEISSWSWTLGISESIIAAFEDSCDLLIG